MKENTQFNKDLSDMPLSRESNGNILVLLKFTTATNHVLRDLKILKLFNVVWSVDEYDTRLKGIRNW